MVSKTSSIPDDGSDAAHFVTVNCPNGQLVVGGGASSYNDNQPNYPEVISTYPSSQSSWTAQGGLSWGSGNQFITVYAVCVDG